MGCSPRLRSRSSGIVGEPGSGLIGSRLGRRDHISPAALLPGGRGVVVFVVDGDLADGGQVEVPPEAVFAVVEEDLEVPAAHVLGAAAEGDVRGLPVGQADAFAQDVVAPVVAAVGRQEHLVDLVAGVVDQREIELALGRGPGRQESQGGQEQRHQGEERAQG